MVTERVFPVEPLQGLVGFAVIVLGFAGIAVTLTLKSLHELQPLLLQAFTLIVPPLAPAVALIEVEFELPLHPEGNCHS